MRAPTIVCPGAILALSSLACAAAIATESFAYPDGPLSGQGGPVDAWTTAWVNNGLDAAGGEAVTNVFANPPKYVWRVFNDPGATNTLFVRFELTTPPAFATADSFGLDLSVGVNNPIVFAGKGPNHNNWIVSGVFDSGIPMDAGRTYIVVAGVVYPEGPVPAMRLLWIDPDASDFYDDATGASSADVVSLLGQPPRGGTLTLLGSLAGVRFDDIILCDTIDAAIPACAGDVNGDGATNAADFTILAGNYGQAVPPNTLGDLNGDGFVNAADFTILAGDFGCG